MDSSIADSGTAVNETRFLRPAVQAVSISPTNQGADQGALSDSQSRAGHTAGRRVVSRSLMRDVTELQRSNQQLRQLVIEQGAMLHNDMIGIIQLRDRRIVWTNGTVEHIFGYEADELLGQPSRILYPDEESYHALGASAYAVMSAGGQYRTRLEMVRKDGQGIWIDASGVLLSPEGQESLWMLADITFIKQSQQRLEHIAHHDVLTGLANRALLRDRLNQSLAIAERTNKKVAVCYLDLDGFKPINDRFGRAAGDDLLKHVAARLLACVGVNDTVCRFGGDEFVLVLTNLADNQECECVVKRIIAEINTPFTLNDDVAVAVSASVGVALCPDDSADKTMLIRHADRAMYQAKLLGRNRFTHFSR